MALPLPPVMVSGEKVQVTPAGNLATGERNRQSEGRAGGDGYGVRRRFSGVNRVRGGRGGDAERGQGDDLDNQIGGAG